jgi:hypothetical protein
MRFWFGRRNRKAKADKARSGHSGRGTKGSGRPSRAAEPPDDDPIKNWETRDQQFLRQAGDPFLDG